MRKNKGNLAGTYVGTVLDGHWNIYQTATGYRVSSVSAITGKANYSFGIKSGKFDTHSAADTYKLKEDHPEIYEAVEKFFETPGNTVTAVDGDPFGDYQDKKPLSAIHHWNRMLLYMRMNELENYALGRPSPGMDAGIRMTYSGIFKFKINEEEYNRAQAYITGHAAEIDLQTLLSVLRDFFDGKYRPTSHATLEAQFNMLGGSANEDLLG